LGARAVTNRDNFDKPDPRRLRRRWVRHLHIVVGSAVAIGLSMAPFGASAQTVLPEINVTAPSPLQSAATGTIDRDKVPANTHVLTATDLDHTQSPTMLDALVRALPGVSLTDQTGNAFQRDLNYRGFSASPVIGTPQGLAIYQNGVRVNEVFGDIVNWDFIPDVAVHRMSLIPNNPIYGLNALGGALSIEMKNGFTYQGKEFEVLGGSFGRIQSSAQAGFQDGNIAGYISADAVNDKGWRQFSSSSSRLNRLYFDLGTRGDKGEFHLAFTGADNQLGGVGPTPVEMLNRQWSSVYTWPQSMQNQLAFVTANASYNPTDALALVGNAYFRSFWQHHMDGNNTEAQFCTPAPPLLCFGDATTPLNGAGGLNVPASALLGGIDRTFTSTESYGGSVQVTGTSKILDRPNNIVVGMSVDRGHVQFNANSELGTVDQNLFVNGTGFIINQPLGDLAPVSLLSTATYTGLFATDTFDITPRLALTAGGRFNVAQINLEDQLGGALSSDNRFSRFNPVVGATFKIVSNVTAYGGYSEANRAPTPLELGCSNPARPCLIDSFLISDPPLKQVVARTVEAGLRENFGLGSAKDELRWNVGVFRTLNTDDIINVASTIVLGQGYFLNAGDTQRQGLEAGVSYKSAPWNAYANYTFIDATFQSPLTLSSPNNPATNTNGNIFVTPGDHIPATPQHRFKAGLEYAVIDAWKLGVDINVVGSQYLIGDESNQNPKVPPYAVVNLHGSYQVTKNVEAFAQVQNLFNQHYYATGTFFSTGSFPSLNLTDPRMFVPGMPLAAYVGMRAKF
jgi:iron complex outermembrane receptor protein